MLTHSIETQEDKKQKTEMKKERPGSGINIKLSFGNKGKEVTIGLDPKELKELQNTDTDQKVESNKKKP